MTFFPPRKHFLLSIPVILLILATCLHPAYAGSESERLRITEAYKSGQIDRKTYVARKLESYFSKDTTAGSQSAATGSPAGSREITLLLKEAALNLDQYDADTRNFLKVLLKRPTDPTFTDSDFGPWYLTNYETLNLNLDAKYADIADKFNIWYTLDSTTDGGGSHATTEEFAYKVADALLTVYQTEITDLGYPSPPDDSAASDNGGDGKYDIYLMDCGQYWIYGYTSTDGRVTDTDNAYYSYMVIDNDFTEFEPFGVTAEDSMKATLAHEFHHAVQMGINAYTSGWYMEATSTWMEDQVFDDINDNRQYLADFFGYPETSLDDETSSYHYYGAWIWNEYLETSWDQTIVRSIWERLDPVTSNNNAVDATSDELVSLGDTLQSAFTEFVAVNYFKTGFYKDADNAAYIDVPAEATYTLGSGSGTEDVSGFVTVDHLASNYIKFVPGASSDATLTLSVDGEDGEPVDAVAIQKTTDGDFVQYAFSLDDTTREGSVSISGFSTADTDEVMLALANYGKSDDAVEIDYSGTLETVSSSSGGGGGGMCFIGTLPRLSNPLRGYGLWLLLAAMGISVLGSLRKIHSVSSAPGMKRR